MIRINRRRWIQAVSAAMGYSASGWLPAFADQAAKSSVQRHCVLLWMPGGPSQTDTFDMKPQSPGAGEFKEIATNVAGLRFSEHLPRLARQADRLAVVRSLNTSEGDHGRGTYLMRTGQKPMGIVRYPTIGSSLSKELTINQGIPNYVAIAPYRIFNSEAYGPGFLGSRYAAMTVGATDSLQGIEQRSDGYAQLQVDDLQPPHGVDGKQQTGRLDLWRVVEDRFALERPSPAAIAHRTVYERALRLMNSDVARAFDLSEEPAKVRDAYGRGRFGQGCLMARRLIEHGVSFVEVSLGDFGGGNVGWDTHQNNFPAVKTLSEQLDAGWATLMKELADRDLLESTTILWMGEFGRTPNINDNAGRDHFPNAWTCVFAGGGIRGGTAYGKTDKNGATVESDRVNQNDVLATLCEAVGVPPSHENISVQGRPIKIVDGLPIRDILS